MVVSDAGRKVKDSHRSAFLNEYKSEFGNREALAWLFFCVMILTSFVVREGGMASETLCSRCAEISAQCRAFTVTREYISQTRLPSRLDLLPNFQLNFPVKVRPATHSDLPPTPASFANNANPKATDSSKGAGSPASTFTNTHP